MTFFQAIWKNMWVSKIEEDALVIELTRVTPRTRNVHHSQLTRLSMIVEYMPLQHPRHAINLHPTIFYGKEVAHSNASTS